MTDGVSVPAGYVRVATLADLPPNTLLAVDVDARRVCLAHADGRVYAFQDNCSHRDFPLSNGSLEDGTIECAWHGARFDLETGRAVRLPALKPIRTYDVLIDDGNIYIAVN